MKPDWKDAPEWAQWLAMDEDEVWMWYAAEPRLKNNFWDVSLVGDTRHGRADVASPKSWDNTLEPRP